MGAEFGVLCTVVRSEEMVAPFLSVMKGVDETVCVEDTIDTEAEGVEIGDGAEMGVILAKVEGVYTDSVRSGFTGEDGGRDGSAAAETEEVIFTSSPFLILNLFLGCSS